MREEEEGNAKKRKYFKYCANRKIFIAYTFNTIFVQTIMIIKNFNFIYANMRNYKLCSEFYKNCKYDINIYAMYFDHKFTRKTKSENFSLFFKMKLKLDVHIYKVSCFNFSWLEILELV